MQPSKDLISAYEAGKAVDVIAATNGESIEWTNECLMRDCGGTGDLLTWWYGPGMPTTPQIAFFWHGALGYAMPEWVTGWRYGKVPACGYSYNFRDQRPEAGVSLACVDGVGDTSDGTYALFNGAQVKVRVGGYMLRDTGSDGEPLVVAAVEMG